MDFHRSCSGSTLSIDRALRCLADIEAAVADGDFEAANAAAQDLKPLLVGAHIDDLVALRERVEDLKLGVIARQAVHADTLKSFQQKRDGAAAYQTFAHMS